MTVQEFKDKLVEAVSVPVYHLMAAPDDECPVLCWQELETNSIYGDDAPVATVALCQLDYYTTKEYDDVPGTIQLALNDMGVNYQFDGMTYDNDREEWRYIWTVTFLGGV